MIKSNKQIFKVSEISPAEYNPRTITDKALTGLKNSLDQFGYLQDIVVNIRDGKNVIVAGHQRLKGLELSEDTEIECTIVDIDEIKEKALNIALNSQAISGEWDLEELEPLLAELKEEYPEFDDVNLDELADDIILPSDVDIDEFFGETGDEETKTEPKLCPHCGKEI